MKQLHPCCVRFQIILHYQTNDLNNLIVYMKLNAALIQENNHGISMVDAWSGPIIRLPFESTGRSILALGRYESRDSYRPRANIDRPVDSNGSLIIGPLQASTMEIPWLFS